MVGISLAIVDPRTPAVAALIAELDAYQSTLYPAASNHFLPVAALRAPNVRVTQQDRSRLRLRASVR